MIVGDSCSVTGIGIDPAKEVAIDFTGAVILVGETVVLSLCTSVLVLELSLLAPGDWLSLAHPDSTDTLSDDSKKVGKVGCGISNDVPAVGAVGGSCCHYE